MDGQIRYETIRNLFYDNDWSEEIIVTGEGVGATQIRKRNEHAEVVFGNGEIRRFQSAVEQFHATNDQDDGDTWFPFEELEKWILPHNKNSLL